MTDASTRRWQSLTSAEAGALREVDPVVVLPVASIEQHGPHLPLSTDLVIGEGVLEEAFRALGEEVRAYALPPQTVGASREHARYPGTLSLEPEVLAQVLFQSGVAVAASGVRRLVLHSSHGGNRGAMDAAGLRLREELGLLVVKAHYARLPRPADVELPESEWRHGLHGGALETAMMLYLRPELVRRDRIQAFTSLGQELDEGLTHVAPEGRAPFSWLAGDLNPKGAVGDAPLASEELGRRLVSHYGGELAAVIRDAGAFPLESLS